MLLLSRFPCLPLGLRPGLCAWSPLCLGATSGGAGAGALTASVSVELERSWSMPLLPRLPCLPLGLSPGLFAWSAICRGTASGDARAGALTAAVSVDRLRRFRFRVRDSDAASWSPSTAFRWTSAERDDCADLAAAPPASATFGAFRFPWSRSLILLISARSGSTMSLIRRSILFSASWRGRAEAWPKAIITPKSRG